MHIAVPLAAVWFQVLSKWMVLAIANSQEQMCFPRLPLIEDRIHHAQQGSYSDSASQQHDRTRPFDIEIEIATWRFDFHDVTNVDLLVKETTRLPSW